MKYWEPFISEDDDNEVDYVPETKKCAECGKEFGGLYDWKDYVYQKKLPQRYYCSWTCYRKTRERQKRIFIKERRIRRDHVRDICDNQQHER